MNQQAYQQYLAHKSVGRKSEARAALEEFLASVETADDTQGWVEAFLERDDFGHRIRHEIYERLVFPVLRQGYERGDARSLLWLARTAQNLYHCPALHAQLDFKSEWQLLAEAYALEPSEEVRRRLLDADLRWFAYCQHEWPVGILYGCDGASLAECDDLLQQIAFARALDDGSNAEFLNAFERNVGEYRARFQAQVER